MSSFRLGKIVVFVITLFLAGCVGLPEHGTSTPAAVTSIETSPSALNLNRNDRVVVIANWHFSVTFPSSEWDTEPYDHAQKPGVEMFKFWRKGIIDSEGREIVPVVGLVFERVPEKTDIVIYSAVLRSRIPVEEKIDDVFTFEDGLITLKYAIGYKWRYTDRYGMEHTVYSVHAIDGTTGVAVTLDATTEVFGEVEGEFLEILKSLEFVEEK